MGLTPDEQKLLDELTARAAEPDAADFEVEIFSGDKGARIPLAHAKGWLYKEFGIGEPPTPPAGQGKEGDQGKDGDQGKGQGAGGAPVRSLFRGGAGRGGQSGSQAG